MDIEEFVYEQIFIPNNLIFANFSKFFTKFIEYEVSNFCIILVISIESHLTNSSINDLNYYLYKFQERTDEGLSSNEIKKKEFSSLSDGEVALELSYPLHNYNDKESNVNERNSEKLVDNLKFMYSQNPEIELYNLSDPFYNDICFLFTSDVDTDMTLNDRRYEYYVNISLCENNCTLMKILQKDIKTPRSLCSCEIKMEFAFSNQSGIRDNITNISSYNSKAVKCISETFNKNSISSNVMFWILMIIIIFLIIMVIRWIFYGTEEIKRILGVFSINPENSDLKISIGSNEGGQNSKYLGLKDNKNSKDKIKEQNNTNKGSKYKNSSSQLEYFTAPINQSNPPKKNNGIIQINSIATKGEYKDDKDLVSNSEPSFFKSSMIKQNDRDNATDISFENLPYDNQILVDNLLKQRNMLENNYLQKPIEFEKNQRLALIKNALYSTDDIEPKRYFNSCEDIYYPKKYRKAKQGVMGFGVTNGVNKFTVKNRTISKLLGGVDLFDRRGNVKNSNNINNNSDNNEEQKFQNYKGNDINENDEIINTSFFQEGKEFQGDEQFFFPKGILGKEGESSLIEGNAINKGNNLKQKGKTKKN